MSKQYVCVRFAPSPTGFLHIGGVRTALFNYLFAKHHGGKFVLRIEDTDIERSDTIFTDDILKSLQWLGLQWDEEPIFQSKRFSRYQQVCHQLVEKGTAYYCYCQPQELEEERKRLEAAGKKPMYGGKCRELGDKQPNPLRTPPVIRFKVPKTGQTSFIDVIRGKISFQNSEIEDFVILRTNQTPTYNLACVVDDYDGKMTHIIRGDDHINNTPKQVLMFEALQFHVPQFAHLPMILGSDKKKLSKRHGTVSANQYRFDGFLPHAVVNYLARLGWGHGDQEIFSLAELIQYFSLEKIGKSNAIFNTEKLLWLNGHYIRQTEDTILAGILLKDFLSSFEVYGTIASLQEKMVSVHGLALIGLAKQKVRTLKELAVLLQPLFWEGPLSLDQTKAAGFDFKKLKSTFDLLLKELVSADNEKVLMESGFDSKKLETLFRMVSNQCGLKLVELAQPTRFLLTGVTVGPPLFDMMMHLKGVIVLKRLKV